jgi:hypothetical protein
MYVNKIGHFFMTKKVSMLAALDGAKRRPPLSSPNCEEGPKKVPLV